MRAPLGVVFNLPAWNYPLLTAVNVVIPAVLSGNVVLLKHSPRSPLCGEHFATAFAEAGAPPGLVQAFHCDHATSERIASTRGSTSSVSPVPSKADAGSMRPHRRRWPSTPAWSSAGSDGAYVAADADLEKAVDGIVDGACYNAGQSCCAVERAYVHRDLVSEVRGGRAGAGMKRYVLGDPTDERTNLGPMAQPHAPAFLEAQVKQALSRGRRRSAAVGRPRSTDAAASSSRRSSWTRRPIST